MRDNALIETKNLTIGYGKKPIMKNIDFTVGPRDFLGLVGPNGGGKSTLLKTILGIIKPISGKINKSSDLRIGYVPQRAQLDPIYPLTAWEVVCLGGMGKKRSSSKFSLSASASKEDGKKALEQVGIAHLAHKPLRDLSGGQQQRALIARALVRSPGLLVLDEPTAGMDLPGEKELLDFITGLNRDNGTSIILVVHQLSLVAGRSTKVGFINKDISLFTVGSSDELLTNERLTQLYGCPMEVTAANGEVIVRLLKKETK